MKNEKAIRIAAVVFLALSVLTLSMVYPPDSAIPTIYAAIAGVAAGVAICPILPI